MTLEPVNLALGGVTGWDVQHVCRNFEQLKMIAEKWKPKVH